MDLLSAVLWPWPVCSCLAPVTGLSLAVLSKQPITGLALHTQPCEAATLDECPPV